MTSKSFCVLFSDHYQSVKNILAAGRTLASIPFGGRYRLIDFALSSLVNSGVYDIGIITKDNYGSLVDHLGWGKDWDLNRKNGGLQILTPFTKEEYSTNRNRSRIDALLSARGYLEYMKSEYIIISDANIVANIDYDGMLDYHIEKQADITVLYRHAAAKNADEIAIGCTDDGKVDDASFFDHQCGDMCSMALGVYIFKRQLLLKLLDRAYTFGWTNIDRDFITRNIAKLDIYAYEHKDYCAVINTVNDYYNASMDLFDESVRRELFDIENPILTQVKNSAPTVYGYSCDVRNSFIADGCQIEGELRNCIIFRDVQIKKGATLNNCIIMQNTVIGENASLNCVISDKDVLVQDNRVLSGYKSYPFVISKGSLA